MVMYGLVKCRRVRVLKTRVFKAMLPFLVEFHQKIEAVVKHCLTPLELHYVALSRIMMLVLWLWQCSSIW